MAKSRRITPCILTVLTCREKQEALLLRIKTQYLVPILPTGQQRPSSPHMSQDRDGARNPEAFPKGEGRYYQHEVEGPQCIHEELAPLVSEESVLEPLVDHGIHFLQPGEVGLGQPSDWKPLSWLRVCEASGAEKGVYELCPSPYGDHVCTITVIATTQVEEGCDIVWGHSSAHIPRDHSDPGGRGIGEVTAGYHLPTFPCPPTGLSLERQIWVKSPRRTHSGPRIPPTRFSLVIYTEDRASP